MSLAQIFRIINFQGFYVWLTIREILWSPLCAQIRFWEGAFSLNPNGIPQQSPGVARNELPWVRGAQKNNPKGVATRGAGSPKPKPRWGFCPYDPLPQGSSCLATLGFGTQSPW